MRWKNFGETTTEEGHKVFFNGKEDKHEHGVGFLVHKDIVNTVMGCRPFSRKLNTISLISHPTCSELSSTDSRPRLRNCWQKTKQVLDQAGAQNRSSTVNSSQRSTYNTSAIFLNSQLRELFKTTGGVRQECSLSTILFNLFLEKIMQETLHNHHTSISISGRPICNL